MWMQQGQGRNYHLDKIELSFDLESISKHIICKIYFKSEADFFIWKK